MNRNLSRCRRILPLILVAIGTPPFTNAQAHAQKEEYKPQRWESQIAAFEEQDKTKPPLRDGILFVGSSSIRGWDLSKSFPDLPVINRGFGGSQVAAATFFVDRIATNYNPRMVVLYAGDNDISHELTPERVAADYQAFVRAVHERLPETRIVFIAIKPSLKRWHLVEPMRRANALIRKFTESDTRQAYADIDTPMIGTDGKPRKSLFKEDGLHLNAEGYKLWAACLRPHLTREPPRGE